jgi:hypothetical protein
MSYMSCPACGLRIRLRASSLTIERCPRCLARRKTAVAMILTDAPPAQPSPSRAPPGTRAASERDRTERPSA